MTATSGPQSGEVTLSSLLTAHPRAPIAAVREDGIFTDMPDSVDVGDHPVVKAASALDLVTPPDRGPMISAWDRARATGIGRCGIRLVSNPETPMTFYAFDARDLHGIFLVAFVPAEEGDRDLPAPDHRTLTTATPKVATTSKDERATFRSVDAATTQILGWTAEEMEGRRSLEFIHPDDQEIAIANWMEMLAAAGPARRVRLRHKGKDGTWFWFEVTNQNLLEDPEHRCVISGMVDVSDEMEMHEQLRAREQLLDQLAEAMPLGLFQIDTERRVIYTNDRLHRIVETERGERIESQLEAIAVEDRPLLERALGEVLRAGEAADIEVELHLPRSREIRYCAINLRALTDEDGVITGAVGCLGDVTDSARMRDELERRATFDELTGCYNRASLLLALETHIANRFAGANRAVIFADLDHFKQVNDEYGHAAGDRVLEVAAERLRNIVRAGDVVGRMGGDEFVVVAPGIGGADEAMHLADRLASGLAEDVAIDDMTVSVSASIGVAWSSGGEPNAETLVVWADEAMYRSKRDRAGRPSLAAESVEAPVGH